MDRGRLLIGAFSDADRAAAFAGKVAFIRPELVVEEWPGARKAFLSSPRYASEARPAELDAATLGALTERMATALFRSSINEHQWRLENVSLAALLTAQPHVNLSRVALMAERLGDGLVPLMFPTDTALNVKAEASEGPTISFMSDRRELTFTGAQVRRLDGSGAIEIVMRIEPRPNYISVVACEGRLFVRNGNHRLVAAWQAGLREVPCVLIEGEVSKLFEQRWNRLPVDSLLSSRPPRITDLTECGGATIEVDLKPRRFVTRVRGEQHSSCGE